MNEIQSKLHDMALEAAGAGVWWWEIEADRLVWDERMHKIFGRRAEDGWTPTYEGFNACVHPEDREWLNKLISQCIARGSYYRAVFRIVRPDETVAYVRAYGQIFAAGALRIFAGVNIEVSADEYDGGKTWELGEENQALRPL
jgi:PAS domain-containing protein